MQTSILEALLPTLDALVRECNENTDRMFRNPPDIRDGPNPMAQYWQDRKQTLLEVRQLFVELE